MKDQLRPNVSVTFAILSIVILFANKISNETSKDIFYQDLGAVRISTQFKQDESKEQDGALAPNSTYSRQQVPKAGHMNMTQDPGQSRCNYNGQHVRIAVSPQPPFVNCIQDLYADWQCNGSNIEVIRVLEKRLNFNADWLVLANNHLHGIDKSASLTKVPKSTRQDKSLNESLKSSGIFGLVGTGRALLSANGVMKTLDREKYNLIVSEPFDSFRLHFLLSKSVRDHDHIFIKPFNLSAWLAIFVSAALVVPVFYFINSTSSHYPIQDDKALAKMSLWTYIRYFGSRIKKFARNVCLKRPRRQSSSSFDLSFDNKIDKMMMTSAKPMHYLTSLRSPLCGNNVTRRSLVIPPYRWNSKRKRRRERKSDQLARKSGFFKLPYIIWYVVASLANQGGETEDLPQASSTRILVAFWWLYLIVVCAIHSGILTAILTFPKQIDFIQTLDDYLNLDVRERMSIMLSVDKFSELAHLLADSDNLHKSPLQLFQQQSVPILYTDFQRHRQRILDDVQQGHSAFIEEKSIITQIITQEYLESKNSKCLFKASRFPIDVIPMSLVLSKQMPNECVKLINSTLRRIMITGLSQKWRRQYDAQGNDCLNSVIINAGDVDKIELKHVILAFWLLLAGIAMGLLFLIGEIVWLLMDEDDDEEEDDADLGSTDSSSKCSCSRSGSSSSWSAGLDQVQLGHRLATRSRASRTRSLGARRRAACRWMVRRARHQQQRPRVMADKRPRDTLPRITFSLEEELNEHELGPEHQVAAGADKRQRRVRRAAQRRARRLQRALEFIKRIHGGKIYSAKVRTRARRPSRAIVSGPVAPVQHDKTARPSGLGRKGAIRRRRPTSGRIAPSLAHI